MLANVVFAETHQKNLPIHVTTVHQRLPNCFISCERLIQWDHADSNGDRSSHRIFLSLATVWNPIDYMLPCDFLDILLGLRMTGYVEETNLPW